MSEPFRLVPPAPVYLASYRAALEAGWSPDNVLGNLATQRQLDRIDRDPMAFLMSLEDPQAKGPPMILPDGTVLPRIPGYYRWMWDGEFCGSLGFRWQNGTSELPPHVLGHVGFTVVPWKRGLGYATRALTAILQDARGKGLRFVELTADEGNAASRRVIEKCGGELVERFTKMAGYGGQESVRYRIGL